MYNCNEIAQKTEAVDGKLITLLRGTVTIRQT